MSPPRDLAASVRQRLRNLAISGKEDFQAVLTRYALERFLYRLSQSQYRDQFILKGALLFSIWSDKPRRATRDMDLLGQGDNSLLYLEQVFREICLVTVDSDGLEFSAGTVTSHLIKADQEYEGVRINLQANLVGTRTRISVQIDIGFGDVVFPAPLFLEFPTLLNFPAPNIQVYPRETVIAEKFQAMVMLGMANSRLKDFYDLWFLAQNFEFEGTTLCQALKATFDRRRTPLPLSLPLALTAEFAEDRLKIVQWAAFLRKAILLTDEQSFPEVVAFLQAFLMPPSRAASQGEAFEFFWFPKNLWQKK